MLKRPERTAILELYRKGVGIHRIAKTLKISRTTVKKVIKSGSAEVPPIDRAEKAARHHEEIKRLHKLCKGYLVRVHEELQADGVELSYQALTAYCRRHGIGVEPKKPTGEYHFGPGKENQHDTSPHRVKIGGKQRGVETASARLCFSRMQLMLSYPRFTRFECKIFLTEALQYMEGACETTMVDNTSVVRLKGTGADMVPVPEMKAFADRYGFEFEAHEVGDANRSAYVERSFRHWDTNFAAGRTFVDFSDLNAQEREWCDKVNATRRRHLRAAPRDLWVMEREHLKPLPIWVPDVYLLHHRTVDIRRYVNIDSNRYSVPSGWIGRRVEIRETKDQIIISLDDRNSVTHERFIGEKGRTSTLPEHQLSREERRKRRAGSREEQLLVRSFPELRSYVSRLKSKGRKQTTLALRQLLRMTRDYPREPLLAAVAEAHHYGLYDLDRVERMVLRRVAGDYFLLRTPNGDDDDER